jgi:hypothetical protein
MAKLSSKLGKGLPKKGGFPFPAKGKSKDKAPGKGMPPAFLKRK